MHINLDPGDKIVEPKACCDGKHVFIPTAWRESPGKKVCTMMTCQHCLLTMDKRDQEVVSACRNERLKEKKELKLKEPPTKA